MNHSEAQQPLQVGESEVKTGILVESFNLMPEKFKNMIEVPDEIIEHAFWERGVVRPRKSDINGEFGRI